MVVQACRWFLLSARQNAHFTIIMALAEREKKAIDWAFKLTAISIKHVTGGLSPERVVSSCDILSLDPGVQRRHQMQYTTFAGAFQMYLKSF